MFETQWKSTLWHHLTTDTQTLQIIRTQTPKPFVYLTGSNPVKKNDTKMPRTLLHPETAKQLAPLWYQ